GPTVLVTTKSGSNQFHGSVFEFFRNTSLDARSYFASEREKFNLNQFGFALGGPIKKDKTFFFDLYGVPLPSGTQVLFNPYTRVDPTNGRDPFKCDGTGNPLPVAADGTQ